MTKEARIYNGGKSIISKQYWNNLWVTCKRINLDYFLTPWKLKWIKDLNVRSETIKSVMKTVFRLMLFDISLQFSSVQLLSHVWLCNPMDCSMPGLPVHQRLPEFTPTHPTISSSVGPFSSCLQSFPASGSFPMSQFFASGGQSIGVSPSASVLPKNIQHWFPLGWTGWISLQAKGLSRVFSNSTVQKHQFFGTQLSLQSNSHIHTWLLENHSLD